MSEKEHIQNINEEFTDFAWSKMQKTLDKEMPVKDKKDRRLFFWLFFFFSLLAIGIYFYATSGVSSLTEVVPIALDSSSGSNSSNENASSATKVTGTDGTNIQRAPETKKNNIQAATKVADTKNVQATSIAKTNNIQAATEVADTKNVQATSVAKTNNIQAATKVADTKNVQATSVAKTNNIQAATKVADTKNVQATSVAKTNNIQAATKVADTKNVQATSVAKTNNTQAATEVADTKDTKEATSIASISPTVPQSHNSTIPQFPQFPKPRKFSRTYSMMLGAMNSNQASDFGGLTAGLVANYRFHSKIGIETGLNYAWLKKPITFYTVSSIDNPTISTDPDSIETVSDPNIAQSENLDIIGQFETNSFHYFRMPIRFTYKPHRKIQLHSGIELAYLWKTGALLNGYAENDAALFATNSLAPGHSSFQKFDANIQAGIRYYPTSRLGLGLHYRQGITDMTADKGGHFNSGFQLSALYQFAPRR